jgi:Leucine-rich repeat (LRR) protein
MRGRFSCQRFLNALSKTTTTTTTTPKAALAGQRHHHLSSIAVGVPKANLKTKSLEEQETERSLRKERARRARAPPKAKPIKTFFVSRR